MYGPEFVTLAALERPFVDDSSRVFRLEIHSSLDEAYTRRLSEESIAHGQVGHLLVDLVNLESIFLVRCEVVYVHFVDGRGITRGEAHGRYP